MARGAPASARCARSTASAQNLGSDECGRACRCSAALLARPDCRRGLAAADAARRRGAGAHSLGRRGGCLLGGVRRARGHAERDAHCLATSSPSSSHVCAFTAHISLDRAAQRLLLTIDRTQMRKRHKVYILTGGVATMVMQMVHAHDQNAKPHAPPAPPPGARVLYASRMRINK